MDLVECTSDRAVMNFTAWELHLILAATGWVLDQLGTGRYGRSELHSIMGIWMEDAEASLARFKRLDPDEPVELSALDVCAAHGFTGEVVLRYLPLGVIPSDAEFERLMSVAPSEAKLLVAQLRDVVRAMR